MEQLLDSLNASAADYRDMASSGDSYFAGFCLAQAIRLERMVGGLQDEMACSASGLRITEVPSDEEVTA